MRGVRRARDGHGVQRRGHVAVELGDGDSQVRARRLHLQQEPRLVHLRRIEWGAMEGSDDGVLQSVNPARFPRLIPLQCSRQALVMIWVSAL